LFLSYLLQSRLLNIEVFANFFNDQLSIEQIETLFKKQEHYAWYAYLFIPIILFLKTIISTFFVHMILIFSNYDITYKDVFKLNLIAGVAYLFLTLFQTISVYMTSLELITQESVNSVNLSMANFVDKESVIAPIYSLLTLLNPYEFIYIIITILGIKKLTKDKLKKSLILTAIIWSLFSLFVIIITSFIQLNMQ
jgi:hypothetical protein